MHVCVKHHDYSSFPGLLQQNTQCLSYTSLQKQWSACIERDWHEHQYWHQRQAGWWTQRNHFLVQSCIPTDLHTSTSLGFSHGDWKRFCSSLLLMVLEPGCKRCVLCRYTAEDRPWMADGLFPGLDSHGKKINEPSEPMYGHVQDQWGLLGWAQRTVGCFCTSFRACNLWGLSAFRLQVSVKLFHLALVKLTGEIQTSCCKSASRS